MDVDIDGKSVDSSSEERSTGEGERPRGATNAAGRETKKGLNGPSPSLERQRQHTSLPLVRSFLNDFP